VAWAIEMTRANTRQTMIVGKNMSIALDFSHPITYKSTILKAYSTDHSWLLGFIEFGWIFNNAKGRLGNHRSLSSIKFEFKFKLLTLSYPQIN
jgi:hypothetical protein